MKTYESETKFPKWWALFTYLTELKESEKMSNLDWCHTARFLSCYIQEEHLNKVLEQLKKDYSYQLENK